MFTILLSLVSLSLAAPDMPTAHQRDSILFTQPKLSCVTDNSKECQAWNTNHNMMHLHSLSVSYASSTLDLKYYRIVGQENFLDVWSDYKKSAKCNANKENYIWDGSCDAEIARSSGSKYVVTSAYILNPDDTVDASITLLDADTKDILRKEYHTGIPNEALSSSDSFSNWTHYENITRAITKNGRDGVVGEYQVSEPSEPEKIKLGQWMALSKSQKIHFFLSSIAIQPPTNQQSDDNTREGREYSRSINTALFNARRDIKKSIDRIRGDGKNTQTWSMYLCNESQDCVDPVGNVQKFNKFYEYLEYLDESVLDEWYMNDVLELHSYRKPNNFGNGMLWGTIGGAALTIIISLWF